MAFVRMTDTQGPLASTYVCMHTHTHTRQKRRAVLTTVAVRLPQPQAEVLTLSETAAPMLLLSLVTSAPLALWDLPSHGVLYE